MADRRALGRRPLLVKLGHRLLVVTLVLALATALAGCLGREAQGDPTAPVLVRGIVLSGAGQPAGGAVLTLSVSDWSAELQPGEQVPVLFARQYSARPDGTFEIRLWPGDVFRETGEPTSFVNFDLQAQSSAAHLGQWSFPREVAAPVWAAEVPEVVLQP